MKIYLEPSEEIQILRIQLSDLTQKHQDLQESFNRVQFNFRCESLINMQLQDYCTEQGLKPPARLFSEVYRDPDAITFLEYKKTLRPQAEGAEAPGE